MLIENHYSMPTVFNSNQVLSLMLYVVIGNLFVKFLVKLIVSSFSNIIKISVLHINRS